MKYIKNLSYNILFSCLVVAFGCFPAFAQQGAEPALQLSSPVNMTMDAVSEEERRLEAEARAAEEREETRNRSFDEALSNVTPLRPEEIKSFLHYYDDTRSVAEGALDGGPRPEVKVHTVSLDPGVAPPVIMTASGHVSSLTILDATGQPWPIQDVSWAGDFDVITPESGGHVVRITPLKNYGVGNLSIRLVKLKTPVTFSLKIQREVVHFRYDARIPEYGPHAKAPLIDQGVSAVAGDAVLTTILDGVPPEMAEKLSVDGVDGRTSAYKLGGRTYIRTPLTLLSPGWQASVSSADGLNVYALNEAPLLLLSDHGILKKVRVSVMENSDDK